jgi:hypothetical protein
VHCLHYKGHDNQHHWIHASLGCCSIALKYANSMHFYILKNTHFFTDLKINKLTTREINYY